MIVSLDNPYHSDLWFLPARSEKGDLVGVEIIANFVSDDGSVRMPTELVIPRLSPEEQCRLFEEKLSLIEACQHFFIQQKLNAWIKLTPAVVEALFYDDEFTSRVKRFSFIELMINENYPELNRGKENPQLAKLAAQFPLILANFGAGDSSMKAIFDGLFKRVVLDKSFVQHRAMSVSFEPFMQAIVSQISSCCDSVMIAGIDTEEMRARVTSLGFSALQGCLWPAVAVGQLTSLVQG
ncbi:EAL domain-containing protein [Citrobacter sp. S2-9]|uniref:EAL domain-containing protein n=1 Tax=Citrobacter enshiensis TaxID=2971264 RepID=A0ABT8PVF8_9ENTR|nr:EAL domain-containing protein [Citrobacter enshiensis]MDN8600062.1 EAL domain-containing protein [Citrobacter enshiensis]